MIKWHRGCDRKPRNIEIRTVDVGTYMDMESFDNFSSKISTEIFYCPFCGEKLDEYRIN